ncbi:MAG TPA: DUF4097 family beta strand repeat-containing protein [Steroidobacteraceae bacterium]|jgi:hypothetical protein|nr:DUF4097 family beta strand repeat-containing protein [Steroidobacteraceae bacterium]
MRTAILALVVLCGAAPALAAEKAFDRTFNVRPGGLLTVDADGADISVMGGDGTQVVVHMKVEGSQSQLNDLTLAAEASESGVTVKMVRSKRGWFSWGNLEGHIDVVVPRSYRVDAKTSGGGVRLTSIAGPSRMRTSGGEIIAKGIKGKLDGETSGGTVRLETIEGDVRAHTSGGSFYATDVRGDIDASTSGGDVRLLRIDGKIRANTSGGGVQCELVGANRGIWASTSGGNIRLTVPKNVGATIDAESEGGSIRTDLPITTSVIDEHRLRGAINGGGEKIYARTSGGNITLSAR